jgi:ABC-type transport system substrate-binding protein
LPNLTNGGINTNTHSYTQTVNSAVAGYSAPSYTVNIIPGENYTFHINPNAEFQNGTAVTAWDVMYSLTRDLLFIANPANPGWIIAQYILPGNFYSSMSFWNITQNMTVDNATNSITIHFQHPMTEALVYQIFFASGTYITSATWLQQQGAGITWTAAGFKQYEKQGFSANWNTKVQFNVDANGPYKISYSIPNSEVVLSANPYYNSPGLWSPSPSIKEVKILYLSSPSAPYLMMKYGAAQIGGFSTSNWNLVQELEAKGNVNAIGTPTLGLFWN